MQRYKSKQGIVYEISKDGGSGGYLLKKVHTDIRTVRRKEVISERKQTYLRSTHEDCLKYMLQVDEFNKEEIK